MMDEYDSRLMERALGAARSAMQNGENPIGCVLAVDGKWLPLERLVLLAEVLHVTERTQ